METRAKIKPGLNEDLKRTKLMLEQELKQKHVVVIDL